MIPKPIRVPAVLPLPAAAFLVGISPATLRRNLAAGRFPVDFESADNSGFSAC